MAFVAFDPSKDFVGRDAVFAAREAGPPTRRLRTLLVGAGYVTAYGGEAVHAGDEVVGRVRSVRVRLHRRTGRSRLAYLPSALGPGDRVEVEVFGELVPAEVAEDVLVDPEGKRVRS